MRIIRAGSIFGVLKLAVVLATTIQSGAQMAGVAMYNRPLQISSWSFQCINDGSKISTSCGPNGDWISTNSQPGTVRLWDSGTNWALMQLSSNTYDWRKLDAWLDAIAAHQPTTVIYTFGHVPCFVASVACTGNPGSGHYWSTSPPVDLTAAGSATFNDFVKALTQHCSPNGHCVKTYIKYWELWNEANLAQFWTGTQEQLYEMFKPAVAIIRNNVPGAITSTPPVCGGNSTWMSSWLNLENSRGRLSDYYGIHLYLSTYTPEQKIEMIMKMVDAKNSAGWTTTPWMNTETNFVVNSYVCSSQYTAANCRGQLVRWHVLQYAYQGGAGGAFHVGWYDWPSISNGGYDTYYSTMMKWLAGSAFTASCSNTNTVWSCPMVESNGHSALIVWNTAGTSNYTPAAKYVDYRSFNGTNGGATTSISSGEVTKIGVIPIMFEAAR